LFGLTFINNSLFNAQQILPTTTDGSIQPLLQPVYAQEQDEGETDKTEDEEEENGNQANDNDSDEGDEDEDKANKFYRYML
jgi:hypothetical protein